VLRGLLEVDESKTEYLAPADDAEPSTTVFAMDAGEFGKQWFEQNENKLPSPNQISEGIQKFYDNTLKSQFESLKENAVSD
jgi:hypothetical protein